MSYIFRDSGEGDLRVRRSRTSVKQAYLEMLAEMDEDDITVSDLTDRAGINRKTFYLHYRNKTALRDEIAYDMVRSLDERFTGDLEQDILILYEFLDTDNAGVRKLFAEPGYRDFRSRLYDGVFSHGAFGDMVRTSRYPALAAGYLGSVVGIYDRYMDTNPVHVNLKKLARNATKLVLCGISGGVLRRCVFRFQISERRETLRSGLREPAMAS